MTAPVKTRLIRIGNSQGIRIPKPLIEQAGLTGELEIEATSGRLTISPVSHPREGWAEAAQRIAAEGDDKLLDADCLWPTEWEKNEWQW